MRRYDSDRCVGIARRRLLAAGSTATQFRTKSRNRKMAISMRGFLLIAAALYSTTASAGEKINVGRQWPANQQVSMDNIDHSTWNRLLGTYVDDDGFVDYRSWQSSAEDRAALNDYLVELSRANPQASASREAQLAFWINAYNAVTIEGILQKYPTKSIRDHTARLYGYNIWHDLLLTVGDQQFSLDSIEHKILRPMGEPRIHFAIVCASISCPRLLNQAYVPDQLEKQLAANSRDFFRNARNFRFDPASGKVQLSQILNWFKDDFGGKREAVLDTIAPYLSDPQAQQLARSGRPSVSYITYNWDLNDQATKP